MRLDKHPVDECYLTRSYSVLGGNVTFVFRHLVKTFT